MEAPDDALHIYAGDAVAMVPLGETAVGTIGAPAGRLTVIVIVALKALVPAALEALTDQSYVAPFASAILGLKEQVPEPDAQPAAIALTLLLIAMPDVFCTTSVYEVAPLEALHA